jgi:hypothetical protein
MSRNSVSKTELVPFIHKLKQELYTNESDIRYNPQDLAHSYLNKVLDKLSEYRQ